MNSISDLLNDSPFAATVPTQQTAPEEETTENEQRSETQTAQESAEPSVDTSTLKTMILGMKEQLDSMLRLLDGHTVSIKRGKEPEVTHLATGEKVVEGVFNGEKMVGSDGKEYAVPPNYASKSKLVEGDMMKLTITNDGSFIFKQIGPIERKRIVGELVCSEDGQWCVLAAGRPYNVLTASISFHKASAGDDVAILVPEDGESSWGAVENVM